MCSYCEGAQCGNTEAHVNTMIRVFIYTEWARVTSSASPLNATRSRLPADCSPLGSSFGMGGGKCIAKSSKHSLLLSFSSDWLTDSFPPDLVKSQNQVFLRGLS